MTKSRKNNIRNLRWCFTILPFSYDWLLQLRYETLVRFSEIKTISFLYGALIVCFLSGMQWQKIIETNIKGFLFFSPIIPLLLVSTYAFINDNKIHSALVIVVSLFLSLSIDLILIKKKSDKWFKKLRVNATILASISFI